MISSSLLLRVSYCFLFFKCQFLESRLYYTFSLKIYLHSSQGRPFHSSSSSCLERSGCALKGRMEQLTRHPGKAQEIIIFCSIPNDSSPSKHQIVLLKRSRYRMFAYDGIFMLIALCLSAASRRAPEESCRLAVRAHGCAISRQARKKISLTFRPKLLNFVLCKRQQLMRPNNRFWKALGKKLTATCLSC